MAQEKARSTRARKQKEEEPVTPPGEQAPAKPTPRRSRKQVAAPGPETVAFHAYLLWQRGEPGDATDHWLRAERDLAAA
jgi:hypothetical protein